VRKLADLPGGNRGLQGDDSSRKSKEEALQDSEERFRSVVENAPFGYYRVGKDGLWQYVNPVWERMHGFSAEEVIGKPFEITQPPEAIEQARELVRRSLAGETIKGEFPRLTRDGEVQYHSFSIQPVRIGDEIVAIEGFADDITERKKAEEALRESEERHRQIFEHAHEGIFQTTPDGKLISMNPAFARMYGYESPEQMKEEVTDIGSQLYAESEERADLTRLLTERGSVEGRETRFKRRDSSTLWVSMNAHVVRDPDGEVILFEGTTEDITKRRLAEERLRIMSFEVEKTTEMIVRVGPDGEILFTNDAAREALGYSSEEMMGINVRDISPEVTPPVWRERWEMRKESGSAQIEAEWRRKDGSTFPAELSLTYHSFEGQEFIVVFARDISERKRAEEELMRAERKYRELSEELPEVVFELDANGVVTYVNKNAREMFGYTDEEIEKGLHALQIISPVDHERVNGAIEKMMDGRSTGAVREYIATRKDGTTFPCIVYSNLVTDENGSPAGIRGLLTDITDRKLIEEALMESEEKYRELADSLPQIVFEIGVEGTFTYVNRGGAELFGYTKEEVENILTPLDVIAKEDRAKLVSRLQKLFHEGRTDPAEYEMLRKDGTTFPSIVYSEQVLKDGEPVGIRGIVTDITERKRVEEELQRINLELDGYAHTVSHDIKGPLATIALAGEVVDMLLREGVPDDMIEQMETVLEAIRNSTNKAQRLTDDLLELAQAGQRPDAVEPVDVSRIVSTVLEDWAGQIEERLVKVEVDEDLGVISANATQVYQVFSNLIRNAIRHNENEKPKVWVTRADPGNGRPSRYTVRDNGAGIPEEDLKKVFVPFFKGDAGDTGIGLSTVKKLINLYGGEIKAYNDGGAVFEFTMPDWPSG